ncbi:MAG: TatD family deoxyribonuclease [Rhodothermaceae bacterium]|nr:TatD family deoxyribonuclease [Rhodothermaceae bacterium]MXX57626.1 TatD family deoxyribonuclease [Rhodothermaceae bacterium]MYD18718.1 TatD family deoxyribonuclease [Rhodothermaceae bacterium]MYD55495.1 TatD family deoxyribonuclease [Rhodothermaceae bacterium]MYI44328.1 TatD family deoxyribonuclease [Rhodothermaceae bacterium]
MLIDTHAHMYDSRFADDLDTVLERARDAGVREIYLPAVDVESVRLALNLCARFDNLRAMAAIHPTYVLEAADDDFDNIIQLCETPQVVAVGECGLDYYWDEYYDKRQPDFFARHIRLSEETGLPLIIHLRDKRHHYNAHRDAVRILERELPPFDDGRARGIFHCFTGPDWLPEAAAKLGFLLGVGGAVTFKNSGVADMLRDVPLRQIVLETDAPYMTPVPYRGRRNEPARVKLVAEKIAEIYSCTVAEVAEITSATARRLFYPDSV